MALIPYVDEQTAPEGVREILARSPLKMNINRMIGHSEAAFRNFARLGNSLLTKAKLDAKLREIAILRTAKLTRSVYEWTQHVPIAKGVGVTDEQVAAMENWEPAKCFTDLQRLVLRFTDEVTRNVKGNPQTLAALGKHLGPAELVELILSIGFWGMVARLLETTEVDLEDFAGKVNLLSASARR